MRKNNADNQQFESHDISDEALENISGGAKETTKPTAPPPISGKNNRDLANTLAMDVKSKIGERKETTEAKSKDTGKFARPLARRP